MDEVPCNAERPPNNIEIIRDANINESKVTAPADLMKSQRLAGATGLPRPKLPITVLLFP